MVARSIASLSISFGLVSIPVKVFSATESKSSISFNLLHKGCGSRLRQQYVCLKEDVVVERADMVKGYEFEKDRYVTFTPEELKALEDAAAQTIDILSFMPVGAIDPIYFDKAYYLGPDKRGAKPYNLLAEAMRETGTCALAKWAWKGKQYMVQIRVGDDGLILQQLLYADEVRDMADLHVERTDVQPAELKLAQQLIEQNSVDGYDASAYTDEEKQRILEQIDKKIAGKKITVAAEAPPATGGEVIDLMEALRKSIGANKRQPAAKSAGKATPKVAAEAPARKTARRAASAPTEAPKRAARK
ncbi:non-homologous end joining protein Ku [Cupriavidus pauculus]|uniref:non-homologous end joining protein Ku n=1 Tax=Cupriavidus pauculus TaxID=82633 RepID=UPI001246FC05|nr:Ku protein [Cupriavidus pauculus]KAB0605265.1 Ku protein [Cupriavidus pauculus]MCM3605170.1 Ku protein [Cupriavidus pauculus]UAK99625.1 Ku protein [Cupriavidus pauculus]